MFSLRSFALIAATIYLLPTDPAQQQRFMEKAVAAANWTKSFCDRNVSTCEVANAVWSDMKQKATFAAALAYDIATRKSGTVEGPASTQASGPRPHPSPITASFPSSGTLTRDDLRPVWRGHPNP